MATNEKETVKPNDAGNPSKHYLVNTVTKSAPRGRDFTYTDYSKNPEVKRIMEKAAAGKLSEDFPDLPNAKNLCAKAKNFIMPEHTTEEVAVYSTDENGLVWIPENDPHTANKIFDALQRIDPSVAWHPMGLTPAPEEKKEIPQVKSTLRDKILGIK